MTSTILSPLKLINTITGKYPIQQMGYIIISQQLIALQGYVNQR